MDAVAASDGDHKVMPTDLHSMVPLELDPRSPKPTGIVNLTIHIPESLKNRNAGDVRTPPRWKTPEFIFYLLVAIIVIPMMVWIPVNISSISHPNYPLYSWRLSPGWILGRQIDNSDGQYRSFRNNIPSLTILACAYFSFKFMYTRIARHIFSPFIFTFALIMLVGLHGTSALKVLTILSLNYAIAKFSRGSKIGPILTWIFNGLILFANERNSGYTFASIHPALASWDTVNGFYPRWHVSFNITMLRLVSFNMDYYWACTSPTTAEGVDPRTAKKRTSTHHTLSTYSYVNYITYVLYPPLYIAGPIMTFNDFTWQLQHPTNISRRIVAGYIGRFLTCLLTMELILHFMYVVAIKDGRAWPGDSPAQLCMIGIWNLMIVWLKLLLPWRFFRLWALLDGIDPPENMVRCMANNYSPLGFWRSWHRSYNLWIVRYIYIPLGGTKNIAASSFLVFSFVALWHDLSFRLLAWGWLVSVFILPELIARHLLPASKYGDRPWYRHVCALGAAASMLSMVFANLVGFVLGTEGVGYLVSHITQAWEGWQFLIGSICVLFVGAQLMFEYREEEMRQGIYRRC